MYLPQIIAYNSEKISLLQTGLCNILKPRSIFKYIKLRATDDLNVTFST